MKSWQELKKEVRPVRPDREMAKSILKMVEVRIKELSGKDRKEFASLVVEAYYEIIKEAITAIMAIDGCKTLSHEALIAYLKEFYPRFSNEEIILADNLRKLRHKIAYEGFSIPADFLERNEAAIKKFVSELVEFLKDKLPRK